MEKEKLITLVVATQKNNAQAAEELYNSFHGDIYYHILKIVNNDSELAADLTQDTFVQILESINQLEEPAAFATWSQKIAFSKCTGYFKKKKELLVDEGEDGYSIFDSQVETDADFIPDEALDKEDLKQTIQKMINELPEEQKSALLLRYFNEISVKEIAEIQGVSEGTVKSRLNYARKAIKASVEEYEKKNDVKLHCAGVIPLLLWFFRAYRSANSIPLTATATSAVFESGAAAPTASVTTTATSSTVAETSVSAATGTAATSGGVGTITKAIAVIAAAAVTIGGVSACITSLELRKDTYEENLTASLEADVQDLITEETTETEIANGYEENLDIHNWRYYGKGMQPVDQEHIDLLDVRVCAVPFSYEILSQYDGSDICNHEWSYDDDVWEFCIIETRKCDICFRCECLSIKENKCQHQWQEYENDYFDYKCAVCGCPKESDRSLE